MASSPGSRTSRRQFLGTSLAAGVAATTIGSASRRLLAAEAAPTNNPLAAYQLAWTDQLKWQRALSIADPDLRGANWNERLEAAQAALGAEGGVVYFPPGVYGFADHIRLRDGVILRGADPTDESDARRDGYRLASQIEFPRYVPQLSGAGTPIEMAFKGIHAADPMASRCGVVNLAINRGHIHLGEGEQHACGRDRVVFGCVLRNAAVADPTIPDVKIGQHPWQRFTARHHAAVNVKTAENVLVANNRLPRSGEDSFSMNDYVVRAGRQTRSFDGVVFDYDNRPGIYVNDYSIGAPGGQPPDGTPETHPWGFRHGIVIRDNYIYATGRCPISFTGDGTICSFNVVRLEKDVWRPTNTGRDITTGASTNDNRAVQMRGWRWVVEGNDYEVYRNWAADRQYLINDGEGLMHEDHVNSTVKDSKLIGNKGNTYISIYKTGGIDGLLVRDNEVPHIMVVADRNIGRYECKNVTIEGNTTTAGGIHVAGEPAANNVVRNNRALRPGSKLINRAQAKLENNSGYDVET